MNGPVVDFTTTLAKLMAIGMSLEDVIARATINPAHIIRRPELGTLPVGSAGRRGIRRHQGHFNFIDCIGTRLSGGVRLENRMTVDATGRIVYDPTGLSMQEMGPGGKSGLGKNRSMTR